MKLTGSQAANDQYMKSQSRNVLILMSDTGGGHRASAEALRSAFNKGYPGEFHVDVVDMWSQFTVWPLNKVPQTYGPLVNHLPWLWKLIWNTSNLKLLTTLALWVVYILNRHRIKKMYEFYRPDIVISVHPLMQHIPIKVLFDDMKMQNPFFTVVTDLASANATWFSTRVERCYVASQEANELACKSGLSEEKVRQIGLPVRVGFSQVSIGKQEARQKVGIDESRRTLLLVGGGDGVGSVKHIAHAVADRLSRDGRNAQIVIICGRNNRLKGELNSTQWLLPVHIEGYVTNMHEWMMASDCIVTKAGPGTIAEATICGLPMILSGYIPGQEEGNISYVEDRQIGVYCEQPDGIASLVSKWFGPDTRPLDEMGGRMATYANPFAAAQIVEDIVEIVDLLSITSS